MTDCMRCGDTGEVNHGSDYAIPCGCFPPVSECEHGIDTHYQQCGDCAYAEALDTERARLTKFIRTSKDVNLEPWQRSVIEAVINDPEGAAKYVG